MHGLIDYFSFVKRCVQSSSSSSSFSSLFPPISYCIALIAYLFMFAAGSCFVHPQTTSHKLKEAYIESSAVFVLCDRPDSHTGRK